MYKRDFLWLIPLACLITLWVAACSFDDIANILLRMFIPFVFGVLATTTMTALNPRWMAMERKQLIIISGIFGTIETEIVQTEIFSSLIYVVANVEDHGLPAQFMNSNMSAQSMAALGIFFSVLSFYVAQNIDRLAEKFVQEKYDSYVKNNQPIDIPVTNSRPQSTRKIKQEDRIK
jgi:hypothetical protein